MIFTKQKVSFLPPFPLRKFTDALVTDENYISFIILINKALPNHWGKVNMMVEIIAKVYNLDGPYYHHLIKVLDKYVGEFLTDRANIELLLDSYFQSVDKIEQSLKEETGFGLYD